MTHGPAGWFPVSTEVALTGAAPVLVVVAAATTAALVIAAAALAPSVVGSGRGVRPRQAPPLQFAAPLLRRRWARRPRPPADDDVADWCDDLARRVRSGESLTTAILDDTRTGNSTSYDPIEQVVRPIRHAVRRGVPLADAVVIAPPSTTAVAMAVAVLRACARSGGSAAPSLARTAAALRDRSATLAERRAQSAQARLSATVLTLLPGGVLALILVTSPTSRSALAGPVGLITVPAGIGLNAAGWWWMRSLLRSET